MRRWWWSGVAVMLAVACGSTPTPTDDADRSDPSRRSTTSSAAAGEATRTTRDGDGPAIDDSTEASTDDGESSATVAPAPVTDPPVVTPPSQVEAAVAIVEAHGYVPISTTDIAGPPAGGLHVIVGKSAKKPHDRRQAFFFVADRFAGTDLAESSKSIALAWRAPDTIALAYAVYRPADKACCPSGGSMIVRFRWTGKKIEALDPIPTAAERR